MYREVLLEGRGVGCVATRDIEEGELILSEEPALLIGPGEKRRGVGIGVIFFLGIRLVQLHSVISKCPFLVLIRCQRCNGAPADTG